ncbi:hypothetical protein DOM21_12540 [Bacteriovorax stolpii]|uniref:nucleotidyltransferase family protein n=1 Tax=Bacteriovorax stolpii TaxID=960 RepID=UPI00115A606A|nr:nucleotidyltransferase family protein [Bacteriovorax stolpii]QDK42254.1 hypothetical protein DOM21_12540 [Bacteriovorax stolpii]
MSTHVKVSCLLLCAGKSTRTYPAHKLLLKLGDQTLLRRVAEEIECTKFYEVLAITGHDHLMIEKELRGLPLKIIHNEHYERGIHSSVREGILHLSPETDYFAICHADQPMLTYQDYNKLIDAAQSAAAGTKLIYPSFHGKRGYPALISMSLIMEILDHHDNDEECSYLFERYRSQALAVEIDDELPFLKVETPQIFDQIKFHISNQLDKS